MKVNAMRNTKLKQANTAYVFVAKAFVRLFLISFIVFNIYECSGGGGGGSAGGVEYVNVPVTLSYEANIPGVSLSLTGGNQGLSLVDTGTALTFAVASCSSGYTLSSRSITSGVINLLKGDQNCLVQLTGFTLTVPGTTADPYTSTGTGSVAFNTYLAGGVATFVGSGGSTDTIKVFVNTQVTQSGVLNTDTVTYNFTDVTAGATNNVSQANVSTAVPISVIGQSAPNFTITASGSFTNPVRYVSTNSDGSANMTFTLQCGAVMTGTGPYSCSGNTLSATIFDYIFIKDTYSQGAITVAQATTAFGANTPTTITGGGGAVIAPGGSDPYGNTLTNGGFYTGTAPYQKTPTSVYTNGSDDVFILRMKDASGNVLAYLYFYVLLSTITQT